MANEKSDRKCVQIAEQNFYEARVAKHLRFRVTMFYLSLLSRCTVTDDQKLVEDRFAWPGFIISLYFPLSRKPGEFGILQLRTVRVGSGHIAVCRGWMTLGQL